MEVYEVPDNINDPTNKEKSVKMDPWFVVETNLIDMFFHDSHPTLINGSIEGHLFMLACEKLRWIPNIAACIKNKDEPVTMKDIPDCVPIIQGDDDEFLPHMLKGPIDANELIKLHFQFKESFMRVRVSIRECDYTPWIYLQRPECFRLLIRQPMSSIYVMDEAHYTHYMVTSSIFRPLYQCSICYNNNLQMGVTEKCGHLYCYGCIKRLYNDRCPLCNEAVGIFKAVNFHDGPCPIDGCVQESKEGVQMHRLHPCGCLSYCPPRSDCKFCPFTSCGKIYEKADKVHPACTGNLVYMKRDYNNTTF